jgi:hypothetical protein
MLPRKAFKRRASVAKWVNMREKRLPFAAAMPHGVAAPADGRWDTAGHSVMAAVWRADRPPAHAAMRAT